MSDPPFMLPQPEHATDPGLRSFNGFLGRLNELLEALVLEIRSQRLEVAEIRRLVTSREPPASASPASSDKPSGAEGTSETR